MVWPVGPSAIGLSEPQPSSFTDFTEVCSLTLSRSEVENIVLKWN